MIQLLVTELAVNINIICNASGFRRHPGSSADQNWRPNLSCGSRSIRDILQLLHNTHSERLSFVATIKNNATNNICISGCTI